MANEASNSVRQRAFGAILRNAILSWQTGLTLAVTIILFFGVQITNIPGWQQWFWLVLGGAAERGVYRLQPSDPKAATQAVAREFDAKYDLGQIHNSVSRQRLQSALEYRRNMITLAGRHDGAMRANMQQTIADINDWIGHMCDLALHIDAFDNNELVERDRKMVPQQIEKTQIRLKNETDPSVKKDLEEQLKTLTQQRDNLDATVNSVKRAEIRIGKHVVFAGYDLRPDVAAWHKRSGQCTGTTATVGNSGRGCQLARHHLCNGRSSVTTLATPLAGTDIPIPTQGMGSLILVTGDGVEGSIYKFTPFEIVTAQCTFVTHAALFQYADRGRLSEGAGVDAVQPQHFEAKATRLTGRL
ncbi:MAG: hypothetical protein R3E39_31525 [Anaerolineae bacterium]